MPKSQPTSEMWIDEGGTMFVAQIGKPRLRWRACMRVRDAVLRHLPKRYCGEWHDLGYITED